MKKQFEKWWRGRDSISWASCIRIAHNNGVERSYTQEQIRERCEQSYKAGFRAGRKQGRAEEKVRQFKADCLPAHYGTTRPRGPQVRIKRDQCQCGGPGICVGTHGVNP